jgi:hypothetical protein
MPSWNIHTAHVERLLVDESLAELGVRDSNAFLFGNFVPDVYVGYMVPDASRKIAYKDTHLADPAFVPTPDASGFYRRYVRDREANDVLLGAWCHLLCDHYYNKRTVEYIDSVGVKPGEQTRIRKQGDFDLFGKTLDISMRLSVTDGLVRACRAFPQYSVAEPDVRGAVAVEDDIVEKNMAAHVAGTPSYSLLTPDFFSSTFDETHGLVVSYLRRYAAGEWAR